MSFELLFTEQSSSDLSELEKNRAHAKRLKAIQKALGYLQTNPRHPGLKTHKYTSLTGPKGEEVFEAYAENRDTGRLPHFLVLRTRKKENNDYRDHATPMRHRKAPALKGVAAWTNPAS